MKKVKVVLPITGVTVEGSRVHLAYSNTYINVTAGLTIEHKTYVENASQFGTLTVLVPDVAVSER